MHDQDNAKTPGTENGRAPARRPAGAGPLPFQRLLGLQSTAGNAAVVQMLRQIGYVPLKDPHQHGAGCGHQQSERPSVQRSTVHDVLRSAGQPLDTATRTDMEARLGADFSDVRFHDDAAAKASAADIGARAYTSGNHVVIGDGGGDKHTLAHELTHVIQQRRGPVSGTATGNGLSVSDPTDHFEREAEANATRVMQQAPAEDTDQREVEPGRSPSADHVSGGYQLPVQRMLRRSDFSSATTRAMPLPRGGNQHRRHVIDHALMKDALESWWNVHSANAANHQNLRDIVDVQNTLNTMNNNINNLWPGDGPDNSAIGMLSHHMTTLINDIENRGLVGQAAFNVINNFHGFETVRQAELARPFYDMVINMGVTRDIVTYLREVQANAGLDLPSATTGPDYTDWQFLYRRFEHLRSHPADWSERDVHDLFDAFMDCPIAR